MRLTIAIICVISISAFSSCQLAASPLSAQLLAAKHTPAAIKPWQRPVSTQIALEYTRGEFIQMFYDADRNYDGRLDASELRAELDRLGMSEVQVEGCLGGKDGFRSAEFADMLVRIQNVNPDIKLRVIFNKLDSNRDSFIQSNEFSIFLHQNGYNLTTNEYKKAMIVADPENEDKISFESFRNAVRATFK